MNDDEDGGFDSQEVPFRFGREVDIQAAKRKATIAKSKLISKMKRDIQMSLQDCPNCPKNNKAKINCSNMMCRMCCHSRGGGACPAHEKGPSGQPSVSTRELGDIKLSGTESLGPRKIYPPRRIEDSTETFSNSQQARSNGSRKTTIDIIGRREQLEEYEDEMGGASPHYSRDARAQGPTPKLRRTRRPASTGGEKVKRRRVDSTSSGQQSKKAWGPVGRQEWWRSLIEAAEATESGLKSSTDANGGGEMDMRTAVRQLPNMPGLLIVPKIKRTNSWPLSGKDYVDLERRWKPAGTKLLVAQAASGRQLPRSLLTNIGALAA